MINKLTVTTNEALRERWSTVSLLTLILVIGKAYSIREGYAVDAQGYFAQVFVALIVSFIVSMAIHIMLFIVFSPKPKPATYIVVGTTAPVKSKEHHEAAIIAMNKEIIAAEKAMPPKPVEKTIKPFDLHKELGIPKRAAKKSSKKAARKPTKKKAAKKKK